MCLCFYPWEEKQHYLILFPLHITYIWRSSLTSQVLSLLSFSVGTHVGLPPLINYTILSLSLAFFCISILNIHLFLILYTCRRAQHNPLDLNNLPDDFNRDSNRSALEFGSSSTGKKTVFPPTYFYCILFTRSSKFDSFDLSSCQTYLNSLLT